MKHLNQINAALVIIALGVVFYSLGQTFFSRQASPIQISEAIEGLAEDEDGQSESVPAEVRSLRSPPLTPIGPNRNVNREAGPDPARRSLSNSSSPQTLASPSNSGVSRTSQDRSPVQILTTPSPAVRRDEEDPGLGDEQEDFRSAVQRMRQQGGVPVRPGSAVVPGRNTSPGPSGGAPDSGRRRQPSPPPARSSMSNQRPPL